MDVAVVGTGHVGLVTCVALAHLGHHVANHEAVKSVAEKRTTAAPSPGSSPRH